MKKIMKKLMIKELKLEAIPYYGEDNMGAKPPSPVRKRICHDCGARYGEYHKPGCDMERCPRCDGQLITCGCLEAEARY